MSPHSPHFNSGSYSPMLSAENQQHSALDSTPSVSDQGPECVRQEQDFEAGKELQPKDEPQDVFPSTCSATPARGSENVIQSIRATDLFVGLGRFPAGFYTAVQHSRLEWRTENKPTLVNGDVEWDGPIPIPSDLSASVTLVVRASFEFQPTLGSGQQLRTLTVTVEQILEHSARKVAFTFPEDEHDKSPCSSLLVVAGPRCSDTLESDVLAPHLPATDLQGQLEETTDRGHRAFSRFRKHEEKQDMNYATAQFQHVLDICPQDHPCRSVAQSNLAIAKFHYCRVNDDGALIYIPTMLLRNALVARPVGHPDRPRTLIHLAIVLTARCKKQQEEVDTADAKALLCEAMDLSSAESYEHKAAILVLQSHGGPGMVTAQSESLLSTLSSDSASGSINVDSLDLGARLLHQFQQSGVSDILEEAISIFEALIDSHTPGDDAYIAGLSNLGVALYHRFDCLGELSDLEEAISRQQAVVDVTSDDHPAKPGFLTNLGSAFLGRFKRLGELSDLEEAISRQRDAIHITPDGHFHKPSRLNNLGTSLRHRFERLGELDDIEEAVSRQQDAVRLTPDGHPEKPTLLSNLGISLTSRFKRLGQLSDLEEAISRQENAISLTPDGHPDRPDHLNSLGNSLITRFERLGELSDVDEAILRQQDAIRLAPDSHPGKPHFFICLGACFLGRFMRLGQPSDLEEGISKQRDGVHLAPNDHVHKPTFLINLGSSLRLRFERLGQLSDLEEVISVQENAVDLFPDGHPEKSSLLNSLGISLKTRFEHVGELSDLEKAILRQRDAVHLAPDGHSGKPHCLASLGRSLSLRFDRLGRLSNLEEAISRQREAVCLIPSDHPDRPVYLTDLGSSLRARFEQLGQLSDLEEAISRLRDAVDLAPDHHPNKPKYLNNLSISLSSQFERFKDTVHLEEAITRQLDAVRLTSDDHPDKPSYLSNLGTLFFYRFQYLEQLSDLEEAILKQRDAVQLAPDGHPRKLVILNNLGNFLKLRFKHLGELSNLEEAVSKQQDVVRLTPDGHPDQPGRLDNLGHSLITRFEHLGKSNDFEQAISSYSRAACAPTGPIVVRFEASCQWAFCCRFLGHQSLHAYSVAMLLLPQLAWIGLPLAHRYRQLIKAVDVVSEAAAAALDSGRPETAVEWLEQGRLIVWGEMFQLRSSYDDLSSAYPDHARRLRELSATLEQASVDHENFMFPPLGRASSVEHGRMESLQEVADKQRMLAIKRDELLQDIRNLPGFERFLLHKDFSELRAAAHAGPVVVLNAANTRCDALIVLADVDHVIHVPLSKFTLQRSVDFQNSMKGFVRHTRAILDDREGGAIRQEYNDQWDTILASLWKCVVKPVLDVLAVSTPGELPRIFWCPTGAFTFLPIHAAGFHDVHHSQPGYKVYDFVVSSYVPTLSILAPSVQAEPARSSDLCLLTVPQPLSDDLPRLSNVVFELEYIRLAARNAPPTQITVIESSLGTVEEVLGLMKEADWVHFACHGVQDPKHPTESGLCLADGRRLKLSDVISLSHPSRGLAFLSACQTAKGDEKLSDEAIHITAGMLFAGYGGVIGSMWSISDRHAPNVARDVYEHLFSNDTRPDYREAARALHVALGRLRETENVSFVDWLPFIHVGL